MIFVVDAVGSITYVSPEWSIFTGQPASEAEGSGWLSQLHPDDVEVVSNLLREAQSQGVEHSVRYRLRRADGQYAWMVAGAVPSFGPPDHTFLGYLGSVTQLSPTSTEQLSAYGTIGRYVPPPSHPATQPGSVLDLVADHLLIAHGLIEADSAKEALPGIRQALFAVGVALAREHRERAPSARIH
ncbi:PAS domain-containing protein [Methylobacterium sp. A54F]